MVARPRQLPGAIHHSHFFFFTNRHASNPNFPSGILRPLVPGAIVTGYYQLASMHEHRHHHDGIPMLNLIGFRIHNHTFLRTNNRSIYCRMRSLHSGAHSSMHSYFSCMPNAPTFMPLTRSMRTIQREQCRSVAVFLFVCHLFVYLFTTSRHL